MRELCGKHCLLLLVAVFVSTDCPCLALDEYLLGQGQKQYKSGDFAGAARHFAEAVDSDPSDVLARYYLANSYASLGLHEKAIAEYQKVRELDPDSQMGRWSGEALDAYADKAKNRQESTDGGHRKGRKRHEAKGQMPVDTDTDRALSVSRQQSELIKAQASQSAQSSAGNLLERAKKEAQRIKDESERAINELPTGRRAGRYRQYMSEQIKQEAKEGSERILNRAKAQAALATENARLQTQLLDEAADGLESQLVPPTPRGKFGLRAQGTNLYVRHYGY